VKFKLDLVALEELPSIDTENGRFYSIPSGEKYPSVTTVLGSQPEKKTILEKWKQRIGIEQAEKISKQAAMRGTEVHSLMENYILHEQIPTGLMPTKKHIFDMFRTQLNKNLTTVRGSELPLYSHRIKLAGRTDLIGDWNGVPSVIDFKTSKKLKREDWIKDYFVQTTAYSLMFEELVGIHVPQVVVLIGTDEENQPQVFVRNRDNYAMDLFRIVEEYYRRIS
jgi:PD-(D/E)XK nuclease superfamily